MHPLSSFYGFESCSNQASYLHGLTMAAAAAAAADSGSADGGCSNSILSSTAEAKALAASKSHSEAERRRRKRINGHLSTLRTLLPTTVKTDKASLLAEVVRRVRELKQTVAELSAARGEDECTSSADGAADDWGFPGEADELRVEYCEGGDGGGSAAAVKASLCCEDRAGLVADLTRALKAVRGKVVRAEMATVGGRTKSVVWVEGLGGGGGGGEDGTEALRRALRVVIDKPPNSSSGLGHVLSAQKRARLGPC